ncbi:vanillate O-demethylase monooxygenase subunit [Novosphingobium chloroacetimidivorans]|uniref:Vanillate O-demethylase monooxygenase subunit n=1 Tax=Novosphingobium chloroacetimidivorans TaxID=1428314 RepID=A0A7W7KAT1_9SPHN|nr:aromatic ring-hydroxylating dioxygenase subunit alpha [Novosphingobium chloroacetimidivorans]MBB4858663.1 vanillate O-demethylase monooxygenase subunit [Novosphingobium chloroacetimidivorans]
MSVLADRETPLIRNCWYVLALASEADRTLRSRKVAGQAVVFYRRLDGNVAVLRDRCPHRSFPLSKGILDGDRLICNYHGLTFAPDGRCIAKPTDPTNAAPLSAGTYPVVERDAVIWIWPGDPALADEALIPAVPWLAQDGWDLVSGYLRFPANYVALHENLMDLSHFAFLHAGNIGTPAYAAAPFRVKVEDGRINLRRVLENAPLPSLLSVPTELGDKPVTRETDTWWMSPGLNLTHSNVHDPDPAPGRPGTYAFKVIHFITPETQNSTHNFWAVARDFRLGDPAIPEHTQASFKVAFQEDLEALDWIETLQGEEGLEFGEIHLGSDRGGLLMRREMKRRAWREAAPAGSGPAVRSDVVGQARRLDDHPSEEAA